MRPAIRDSGEGNLTASGDTVNAPRGVGAVFSGMAIWKRMGSTSRGCSRKRTNDTTTSPATAAISAHGRGRRRVVLIAVASTSGRASAISR